MDVRRRPKEVKMGIHAVSFSFYTIVTNNLVGEARAPNVVSDICLPVSPLASNGNVAIRGAPDC